MKKIVLTSLFVLSLILLFSKFSYLYASIFSRGNPQISDHQLKDKLKSYLFDDSDWPSTIKCGNSSCQIKYSFDEKLTKYIRKKIQSYHPEYVSVVVIDNNTGGILTALDYQKNGRKFGKALTFSSTHPAASIFKIITASELLENTNVDKDTVFNFVGRSTTLYKYQLREPKSNRWLRTSSLSRAFALSNNVIFGKAAINNISASSLYKTALKFGLNMDLLREMDLGKAVLLLPTSQYELAEFASGFNRKTLISPIHGALFASVIANDGQLRLPHFVESVTERKTGQDVWNSTDEVSDVISSNVASDVSEMMELTIDGGTARTSFRPLKKSKLYKKLKIGGKTGTITGGMPYGKRDWFVSYALPRDGDNGDDRGISVCVMIVNVNKWYIKSSVLAQDIINYYFNNIQNI